MEWIGVVSKGEPVSLKTTDFSLILMDPETVRIVMIEHHTLARAAEVNKGTRSARRGQFSHFFLIFFFNCSGMQY